MTMPFNLIRSHREKLPLLFVILCLMVAPWIATHPLLDTSLFVAQPHNSNIRSTPALLESPFSRSPYMLPPSAGHDALWNQSYGGPSGDYSYTAVECSSGGFTLAGTTMSCGTCDVDYWMVHTDQSGNHIWNQTYGGAGQDYCYSMIECTGGGFALAGTTDSFGAGNYDMWLVRTDAAGNHLWNQTYGTSSWERCDTIVECVGGGVALAGYTSVSGNYDAWLVRTDASGIHQWNQTLGSPSHDYCYGMTECGDGGFALTGKVWRSGYDAWLVRTDSSGDYLWDKYYGGSDDDNFFSVIEYSGGGYVMAGYTKSFGAGNTDVWLVGTDTSGNQLWDQTFGGSHPDSCRQVIESSAGGFAVAAATRIGSYDNGFLIRVKSDGSPLWTHVYDDIGPGPFNGIVECNSGGYALTGHTYTDSSYTDFWLVRVPEDNPPTWIEMPTDQTIEFGTNFQYDLNASDSSGLDTWWINDTTHFTITEQGVITNTAPLTVGTYGFQVMVNDTYNNILAATVILIVQDTTPPIWIQTPTDQEIVFGQYFECQLNATDLAGIALWVINDTTHFAVDDSGYLTSTDLLAPDSYGLTITCSDPSGNPVSVTITITVQPSPMPPIPGFPIEAIALGVTVALGLGLVARRNHCQRKS